MWSDSFYGRDSYKIELIFYFNIFLSFQFCTSTDKGALYSSSRYSSSSDSYNAWKPSLCPRQCVCRMARYENPTNGKMMRVVNCSYAGLNSMPKNVSLEADVLILSYNRIRNLKIRDSLKNLKYLDVSSNRIYRIDDRLQKLIRLKSLDLQNNSLSHLQNGQFSGLKYLATLDLSYNELHSIEKHTFGGLNYLQRLYLSGNKISKLERQWFFSMPSLRWLYLSHNFLKELNEPGMFESLEDLAMIKVDYNRIRYIHDDAFHGLNEMSALDLSYNKLNIVPTINIRNIPKLQYLYLDGNPIYRINTGAFDNFNISFITASYMPDLTVIERNAFTNLSHLLTLQLHDNVLLMYVDSHAFFNVPKLQNLYLHNNRLIALPENIRKNLPSLSSCHFYNNAIRCDCNAYWIKQELVQEQLPEQNYTAVMYDDSVLICDSPQPLNGKLLKELSVSVIDKTCAPVTIPLFEPSYNISVGEELRLECHAIGMPEPDITWRLPNGSMITGLVNSDRIELVDNCTLIIRHLRITDSGTYMCKAANDKGFDMSSTSVTINNKPVKILPMSVSGDYVTIKWNGTTYRSMISDYQIHWRATVSTYHYDTIRMGAYSTSYTFANLKPFTMYEFCIVYVYETEQYVVDCVNVTTTHPEEFPAGISKIDKRVVMAVCAVILLCVALGCVIAVAQRFHKRKEYLEPTKGDKIDPSMQIPLDNVYNPPSTPYMCSSRTSLISAQD